MDGEHPTKTGSAKETEQQRLLEDLSVAHRIQLSLLPDFCPIIPGWELCTEYQAARQVSGDFYDFIEFNEAPGHLGLVIADVADKGVPAALFGAMSRTTIRATASCGYSPAEALLRANDLMMQSNRSDIFLTAFYALLNIHTGNMVYANAGHNRPLWFQKSTGKCCELVTTGMALAIFEDIQFKECAIDLAPGDKVVFYTDGVTEAMDAELQEFGGGRLQTIVETHSDSNATTLLNAIVQAVTDFCGDTPQSDDFTLFVLGHGETSEDFSAANTDSGCLYGDSSHRVQKLTHKGKSGVR